MKLLFILIRAPGTDPVPVTLERVRSISGG
jgi:hypothetical protein